MARWKWTGWLLGVSMAWWLIGPPLSWAHVGAPYPVLLEEAAGPYLVSALADPDVGTGTFYILTTLLDGQQAPRGTVVTAWVKPQDGHASEFSQPAERQETRYGERFVAKVPFDAEGPWQVRFVIEGPAGTGEVTFPVEVTPAGLGWLTTLGCLLPFAVLGWLWFRGARRQRTDKRPEAGI